MEDTAAAILGRAETGITIGFCYTDTGKLTQYFIGPYADRRVRNPTKAGKDLLQSAALLEATFGDREDDYKRLWKDLHSRGAGWRARARKGLTALKKLAPELEALPMMDSVQRKFGPTPPRK